MGLLSKLFSRKSVIPNSMAEKNEQVIPNGNFIKIAADNPITNPEEDTVGRYSYAQSFSKQILSLDTSKGNVVGILGPWGSGKTSFINLVRNELKQDNVVTIDFNPWMFSGTEQLIQYFFSELSAQLKLRYELNNIGEAIESYGELFAGMSWMPIIGPWIERSHILFKFIGRVLRKRKEGVEVHRRRIEDILSKIDKKITVVIDDIDRLSTNEIKDIFKLVRLTANFPNVIYIVAFDRTRVETALNEEGINGRDYLEKILQIIIDIPPIPHQILSTQILTLIDHALQGIEKVGPFDKQEWPDIFYEIIRPLIRTMRDARRYAVNIRTAVASLEGQVALTDVLALEAIRIFMPDVFILLHTSIDALTTTAGFIFGYSRMLINRIKLKLKN